MTSPAQRHRQRVTAQKSASAQAARPVPAPAATPAARRAASDYELQRAALGDDLRALKDIQSIEAKIARKVELLPKYDAWADGILAAARAAEDDGKLIEQDDILVQTMIWAIDTADAERALPRARTVLRHGMELPSRFERTLGCMIAEEFAEVALKAMATDQQHIADRKVLLEIAELTEDHDMPDQARAKLHKAIGITITRAADAATEPQDGPAGGKRAAIGAALGYLNRALALDSKVGVKKLIEQRTRELEKLDGANDN